MYKVELGGTRHSGPPQAENPAGLTLLTGSTTPIVFLGHLGFLRSLPSLDRLLPCEESLWIPAFAGMTGAWERVRPGLLWCLRSAA